MLVGAIVAAGGPQYEVRQIDPVNDQDGGEPGGNIRQGFLFRSDRGLAFIDRPGGTSTSETTVTTSGGAPRLSSSPGRIDPSNAAWTASRKPLAGEFTYQGQTLFVIANHLIAKAGDDPLFGRHQPPVEVTKPERLQQAQVVHDFVQSILAVDESANVVVLGDMNDFQFSDPLGILTGASTGDEVLTDLVNNLPEAERYSYDFEGNSETLDHILTTQHLTEVTVLQPMHVNAEFADQASDHDPMLALITLVPDRCCPVQTKGR
jgi:predicted extracellular nuclease